MLVRPVAASSLVLGANRRRRLPSAAVGGAEIDVSNLPARRRSDDHDRSRATGRPARRVEQLHRGDDARLQLERRRATWTSSIPIPARRRYQTACPSDPGVAIDLRRAAVLLVRPLDTVQDADTSHVYVASRAGPDGGLVDSRCSSRRSGRARFDDKPAIAVDARPLEPAQEPRLHRLVADLAQRRLQHRAQPVRRRRRAPGRAPVKVNRTGRQRRHVRDARRRRGTARSTSPGRTRPATGSRSPGRPTAARTSSPNAPSSRSRASRSPLRHRASSIPASLASCIQADPTVSVDTSRGPRHRPRLRLLHGDELHRRRRRVARDLRQPAAPAGRLPGDAQHRLVARAAAPLGPVLGAVRRRPLDGSALDLLLRHDRRPDGKKAFYSCSVSRNGGTTWARRPRGLRRLERDAAGRRYEYGYYQGLAVSTASRTRSGRTRGSCRRWTRRSTRFAWPRRTCPPRPSGRDGCSPRETVLEVVRDLVEGEPADSVVAS